MKVYNKKLEITRVFKHFILEWDDPEKYPKASDHGGGIAFQPPAYLGTEVYDSKEELLNRVRQLL